MTPKEKANAYLKAIWKGPMATDEFGRRVVTSIDVEKAYLAGMMEMNEMAAEVASRGHCCPNRCADAIEDEIRSLKGEE